MRLTFLTSRSGRRMRAAATAFGIAIAVLVLMQHPASAQAAAPGSVPGPSAEMTMPSAVTLPATGPASPLESAAGVSPSSGPGRRILADADPCSLLFGSMKQDCESAGKSGSGGSGPSLTDIPGQIEQAIDSWFGNLVKAALSPVLNLLGELLLATPNLTIGRISSIWEITLGIADTCFVLLAVAGGIIVMTHDSVQTRYGLKQALPRLVFAFTAMNSSLLLVNQIATFGNAVTLAVWYSPVSGAGIGNQLLGHILASVFLPEGIAQIFMILFGLVLAVLAVAVLFSLVLRTAALLLLTILAPLMLACHALPGLDAAAKLWWRAVAAVFAIQFLQTTTLMLMLLVFFDPDSNILGVPTATGIVDLLVCGALFVILLKIPGWVLRATLGHAPRSTAMSLLRTAAVAAMSTAAGMPGLTSSRMIAGRLGSHLAAGRIGSGPMTGRVTRATRANAPRFPRPNATSKRPNFGSAHGRPGPGGQGVLFPLPPGTHTPSTPVAASGPGHPSSLRTSASGPRSNWVQPPLFPNPMNFGTAHGRPGPAGQGALFPIPAGSWRPAPNPATAPASQAEETSLPVARPAWVQPGLFPAAPPGPIRGRQHALFPLPAGARRPVPSMPPTEQRATQPGPRYTQPALFPRSGRISPTPVARPVGAAPSVPRRAPDKPPAVGPRLVPVRMAVPPPPERTRTRRPNARVRKGGG